MKELINQIIQFNEDAGTELGREYMLNGEASNEVNMLSEELNEVQYALLAHKKIVDGRHVDLKTMKEVRTEVLDGLADIIYVAIGTAVKLGMDIEGAVMEVSRSNMTKYDDEGNLNKDENGKIVKGDNYIAPDLSQFV